LPVKYLLQAFEVYTAQINICYVHKGTVVSWLHKLSQGKV